MVRASSEMWVEEEDLVEIFETPQQLRQNSRALMTGGTRVAFMTVVVLLFGTALSAVIAILVGDILFRCRNNRTSNSSAEFR